jgi:hypothetical protein
VLRGVNEKYPQKGFFKLLPIQVQHQDLSALVRVFEMLIEWDRRQTGQKEASGK